MSNTLEDSVKLIKEILATASVDKAGVFKLPAERTLAEKMNLQRSTIRNALSALEFFGFIERNQGSGTYIKIPNLSFANVYFEIAIQLGYISLETIEKARELFEIIIVEEAAKNATDGEVAELSRLCDVMTEANGFDEKIEADYSFHLQLAGMTRNPVIVLFFQSIASFMRDILRKRRSIINEVSDDKTRINSNHTDIVDAIAKRDPELAKRAMKAHFEQWERENLLINVILNQK